MDQAGRDFLKMVPSIRKSMLHVIMKKPLLGEKMTVPGRECELEIWLHRADAHKAPVVFEMHGGGFVMGDAAKDDNLCERLKDEAGVAVIGVNYRKAPEHPYPAAWQDVYDVIKYVHDNPEQFGIDPDKMAVFGHSSGGNLAAVVSMKAAASKEFDLKCQILNYPYLDGASSPGIKPHHPCDIPLELMEAFTVAYGSGHDNRLSDLSPLYATVDELAGSAPAALFLAEQDALNPEGHAFAARLRQAGVEVLTEEDVSEMHHGYFEDYFNPSLYKYQDPSKRKLHSPRMGEMAEEVLKKISAILNGCFF